MKASPACAAAGFLILFALYQSAEGIGQRIFHSFGLQATLMALCVIAAWPVGRYLLGGKGYDVYALDWKPRVPIWLAAGLGLALVVKTTALVAGVAGGFYDVKPADLSAPGPSLARALGLALISTFIASLAEDILTRGFWWPTNLFRRGAVFVIVTSFIYVLNHVYRLGNGPHEWVMLFCFGVAYASAMVRTGSLWAALAVHWGWNLSNAVLEQFASVESLSPHTPLISAVAHLAMAAIILGLPRRHLPWRAGAPSQPAIPLRRE